MGANWNFCMIIFFPPDLYTTSRRPKPFTWSPIPHPCIVPDFQADKFSATNMMVLVCVISSSLCSGSQLYRQWLPLRYHKGRERWLLSSTCVKFSQGSSEIDVRFSLNLFLSSAGSLPGNTIAATFLQGQAYDWQKSIVFSVWRRRLELLRGSYLRVRCKKECRKSSDFRMIKTSTHYRPDYLLTVLKVDSQWLFHVLYTAIVYA